MAKRAADAKAVLSALTVGPQILVGSSMGGWIALLCARAMPERVVTNTDFEGRLETNDAWIRERTGITERRYADPEKGVAAQTRPCASTRIQR